MEHRLLYIFLACIVLSGITGSCERHNPARGYERDAGLVEMDAGVDQGTLVTGYAEGEKGRFDVQANVVDWSKTTTAFPARNVVLLLGDGMSLDHVNLARIYKGGTLRVDALRGPVLCKNNSRSGVPDSGTLVTTDSAAAATAIATGSQVFNGVLSQDSYGNPLKTVLEIFAERGKSSGLITNSFVLDASPMAMATHSANRSDFPAIAAQLFGRIQPEIILGGWMADFSENDTTMAWGAIYHGYQIVSTTDALLTQSPPWPSKVLGLFRAENTAVWPAGYGLTPAALRGSGNKEPTLVEMTRFALERLSHNDKGFFLFVEDEHADSIGEGAAGYGETAVALLPPETAALDDALGAVLDWVRDNSNLDDTLVVFTADHETGGITLSGDNPPRVTLTSYSHSLRPVPLYAIGPGSAYIGSIAHLTDVFRLLIGTLSVRGETAPPDAE